MTENWPVRCVGQYIWKHSWSRDDTMGSLLYLAFHLLLSWYLEHQHDNYIFSCHLWSWGDSLRIRKKKNRRIAASDGFGVTIVAWQLGLPFSVITFCDRETNLIYLNCWYLTFMLCTNIGIVYFVQPLKISEICNLCVTSFLNFPTPQLLCH